MSALIPSSNDSVKITGNEQSVKITGLKNTEQSLQFTAMDVCDADESYTFKITVYE